MITLSVITLSVNDCNYHLFSSDISWSISEVFTPAQACLVFPLFLCWRKVSLKQEQKIQNCQIKMRKQKQASNTLASSRNFNFSKKSSKIYSHHQRKKTSELSVLWETTMAAFFFFVFIEQQKIFSKCQTK